MAKSIISNERECFICKTTFNLHRHHVFFGTANRKKSEQYGCWVYLCGKHHNLSNAGVHFNKSLDMKLKQICQKKWEEINGAREDFIRTFGRNYLEVDK